MLLSKDKKGGLVVGIDDSGWKRLWFVGCEDMSRALGARVALMPSKDGWKFRGLLEASKPEAQ